MDPTSTKGLSRRRPGLQLNGGTARESCGLAKAVGRFEGMQGCLQSDLKASRFHGGCMASVS